MSKWFKKSSYNHRNFPAPNVPFHSPGISAPSCFYKLMLSPTFPCTKLRIPEKFASRYRGEIGPYCTLTVPTGARHRIGLIVEENGELWFTGGWKEFVMSYSIRYGSFMLFEYNGNSKFSVNVFDLSGCEITYERNDEVSVEQFESGDEDGLCSSSGTPNCSVDSMVESLDSEDGNDEVTNSQRSVSQPPSMTDAGVTAGAVGQPIWLRRSGKQMDVLADAGIPKPANPFFVCSINKGALNRGLCIPATFIHEHLNRTGDTITVKLHGDGREWASQFCRIGTRFALGTGWMNFARDVFLKIGDVCLFELIDVENSVFQVQVVHIG